MLDYFERGLVKEAFDGASYQLTHSPTSNGQCVSDSPDGGWNVAAFITVDVTSHRLGSARGVTAFLTSQIRYNCSSGPLILRELLEKNVVYVVGLVVME